MQIFTPKMSKIYCIQMNLALITDGEILAFPNELITFFHSRLSTPGYIFGKRIIFFLFLMSVAGILNYYLGILFGSDFQMYIKTITNTISPLLLIP